MLGLRTTAFAARLAVPLRTALGAGLLLVLGLATSLVHTDGALVHAAGADSGKPTKGKAGASAKKSPATKGVVVDRFDIEVRVEDLRFYEASSGFLSSGKGKALKELRLWHGAHEILVQVQRLRQIEVHRDEVDKKNDLVWVTVTLKDGTKSKAKVERTLEVRGTVHLGAYKIRIDRVKRIEFDR